MAKRLGSYGGLDPRTARALLVPDYATNVPDDVAAANETAAGEVAALERATEALREAKRVARGAKAHDKAAAAEAYGADKRAPAATEAKAWEAVELATRTREVCQREADRAIGRLHDAIAAHTREWWDAQQPATDRQCSDAVDQVDELRRTFAGLADHAAIETGLARFDPAAESPKVRCLTIRPAAAAKAERLLDELAACAAELVPERGRTALEGPAPLTPEQEALRDAQRAYRQMGRGGVVVAGREG